MSAGVSAGVSDGHCYTRGSRPWTLGRHVNREDEQLAGEENMSIRERQHQMVKYSRGALPGPETGQAGAAVGCDERLRHTEVPR